MIVGRCYIGQNSAGGQGDIIPESPDFIIFQRPGQDVLTAHIYKDQEKQSEDQESFIPKQRRGGFVHFPFLSGQTLPE